MQVWFLTRLASTLPPTSLARSSRRERVGSAEKHEGRCLERLEEWKPQSFARVFPKFLPDGRDEQVACGSIGLQANWRARFIGVSVATFVSRFGLSRAIFVIRNALEEHPMSDLRAVGDHLCFVPLEPSGPRKWLQSLQLHTRCRETQTSNKLSQITSLSQMQRMGN